MCHWKVTPLTSNSLQYFIDTARKFAMGIVYNISPTLHENLQWDSDATDRTVYDISLTLHENVPWERDAIDLEEFIIFH